jgi:hypothetical protein
MILEFKPDTPAAIRKGNEQLSGYLRAVSDYYSDRIKRGDGNGSSPQENITDLVKGSCVRGGSVVFDVKVEPYPLCEKRFECTR